MPTLRDIFKSDQLAQDTWAGIWAPAKTPREVISFLHNAIARTMADSTLRQQYEAAGSTLTVSSSPEEFGEFMRRENDKWREIVKVSGAKPD